MSIPGSGNPQQAVLSHPGGGPVSSDLQAAIVDEPGQTTGKYKDAQLVAQPAGHQQSENSQQNDQSYFAGLLAGDEPVRSLLEFAWVEVGCQRANAQDTMDLQPGRCLQVAEHHSEGAQQCQTVVIPASCRLNLHTGGG